MDLVKIGNTDNIEDAIQNLIKYYKESANYDCPYEQAKSEVDDTFERKALLDAGMLEEEYTFPVMNTPLSVDRKLLWICPIPCVRKYLEEQCGYKTRWYHKLFWRGTLINMVNDAIKYLERLSKDDLLVIIKYGLKNSNAPEDVTVEDIFNIIGCKFIELK